jgi:hypothetical protein
LVGFIEEVASEPVLEDWGECGRVVLQGSRSIRRSKDTWQSGLAEWLK